MEYEKEVVEIINSPYMSKSLAELLSCINALENDKRDIELLEDGIKRIDNKISNISMFGGMGTMALLMSAAFLPPVFGFDSYQTTMVTMWITSPLLLLIWSKDDIKYKDPNSKLYKFFKKPKWLVSYFTKLEQYHSSVRVIGMKLDSKELQLELLEYLESQKKYIPVSHKIKYETDYMIFMEKLSEDNYIEAILKLTQIITFINQNTEKEEQITYLSKLKHLIKPKSNMKKWL